MQTGRDSAPGVATPTHGTGADARVATVAAESTAPLRLQDFDASATAAGLAAALALLVAAAAFALAVWTRRLRARPSLAERESRNGDTLLHLAREIEAHVARLEQAGRSAGEQRRWARLCRRIAGEHLECVNALLLEGLRREVARPPPAER